MTVVTNNMKSFLYTVISIVSALRLARFIMGNIDLNPEKTVLEENALKYTSFLY